jgi:colicin import membrane protein
MTRLLGAWVLILGLLLPVTDGMAQTAEKEKAKAEKSTTKAKTAPETEKAKAEKSTTKAKTVPETEKAVEKGDEIVGKTADGKPVYAGSRGGHYYLTASGNKTYVDEFVGARIVGKTKDGSKIYEGPKGGWYYYNSNGNKTYVPKDGK